MGWDAAQTVHAAESGSPGTMETQALETPAAVPHQALHCELYCEQPVHWQLCFVAQAAGCPCAWPKPSNTCRLCPQSPQDSLNPVPVLAVVDQKVQQEVPACAVPLQRS